MKFDNQLRNAVSIITRYGGEEPLSVWLKDYFRLNKQMGSRDRKTASQLVYGYYRLGHSLRGADPGDKMIIALFLCGTEPSDILRYFRPEWDEQASVALDQKVSLVQVAYPNFDINEIFPWKEELSATIDHRLFCLSFLRQPDLFLRIRTGYEQAVFSLLKESATPHEFIAPYTVRLANGLKLEELFTPDKEVVVQDYSSQRVGAYLQENGPFQPSKFWDACAASGGKSILAFDLFPGINITVSDIRESILVNLRRRFQAAGIGAYHSFVADLIKSPSPGPDLPFDLILADVPCSGSGTWGRTPEELYFFKPSKISHYTGLQERIIANIASRLSPGTRLLYTTCSVFRRENEEMASLLREEFRLKEIMAGTISGYEQGADTMYAARFISGS